MKLPPSVRNWVSLAGATVALIALFMIVFLLAVTTLLGKQGAYLGLVVYILLPAVLFAGLVAIPVGMLLEIRREHKAGAAPPPGWPRIDFNIPHQRNAALVFVIGSVIFLFLTAVGSYQAFQFTESVAFCGTLCHTVMKPEYTAHKHSPHARVACVECHVGPGVDWYVRSKLSGLYQVYAVAMNVYPRPIPTPIENLRPARAVCEQCHWPQKFYAYQYLVRTHFLQDEHNTRWDIGLALKVGPAAQGSGYRTGIHWHVNPHVKIEYIASDKRREKIPWVRYTNLVTGKVKVFQDAEHPLTAAQIAKATPRVMDCLDCHNRPSHDYLSPNNFLNLAMASGKLPTDLPELKETAVALCSKEYKTSSEAARAIATGLRELYRKKFPAIWHDRRAEVEKAVKAVQAAFAANIFPEMRVRWSAYPDHIGHLESPGCFRCHNGRHHTATGETIPRNCDLCHNIVSQGRPGHMQYARVNSSLEFKHPVDIGGAWKEMACSECHGQSGS